MRTKSRFQTVSSEAELDRAIASAGKQGRMIMVDFSADWCVECKVMERNVLSVPAELAGAAQRGADPRGRDARSINTAKS